MKGIVLFIKNQFVLLKKIIYKNKNIQFGLLVINFFTLFAFIILGIFQNQKTQKAINMADSANSYTRQSIRMMDSANKMDLRAYVVVKGIEFSQDNAKPLKWSIRGTNTGKTPAYNMYGFSEQSFKVTDINRFMKDIRSKKIEVHPIVQGNGIDFEFLFGSSESTAVPRSVFVDLSKQGVITYIYGIISYNDVFKTVHETRFCYFIDSTLTVQVFNKYNDAD